MKNLAMHILDVTQNSISAGAGLIRIEINEQPDQDKYEIVIADDGKGIDPETLDKVTDPYTTSRTTRKVGMGLALFKQNAEQSGGFLDIESALGKGTSVRAVFGYHHLDRPSLGDIVGTVSILVSCNPDIDFLYKHRKNDHEYVFDTREVKEILTDMPLNEPRIMRYIREMIHNNLEDIDVL